MPTAACQPPPARIAPVQRAAHVTTGTLHGHAACSQRRRPHTASRSKRLAGVPPERCATHRQRPRRARPSCSQAPRERRTRHGLCFSPEGQARCANCLETALVPRLRAPCRNSRVWNHPAAARRRGLSHVPRTDAAMFPLGGRRASRAPVHDHSRPIPPTSCRDAQDSHLRTRDHREASCQLRPLSSIQPRAHPAPAAPAESPAPKGPPPPQAHSGTGIAQRR